MAGKRRIVVEFLGNDTTLGKTADHVEGRMGKLGNRLRTVGKVGALGLAAGVAVAGKALFDMGKAAAEDAQSQALLAKALKNSAGATKAQIAQTEDWITAQGKALGVADDKLRPALSNLVRATGDVGEAQKLASLAMDVSAGSGKDLGSISLALAKAQKGQVSGLGRLGIATKDANGKTKTFAQIQKDLAKQFGGSAAASADTFAGKMGRLRLMFDEAKETIGAKLLPVAERFADWFIKDAVPAIGEFSDNMRTKLGPVIEQVRETFARVFPQVKQFVADAFESIRSIVESVVSIVQSLWSRFGDTMTQYTEKTFGNLRTVIGGALKVISGVFKTIAALLKGDWRGAWEGIKRIASGALDILRGLVSQGLNAIKTAFRLAWTGVTGIVRGAWNGIKDLARSGVDKVVGLVRGIGRGVSNAAKGAFDGIKNAFRATINWIIEKWNGLNFHIDIPDKVPGLPDEFNFGTPNIPKLARGGVVRARPGGTLALLGEGGHDEAVVPLSGPHAPRQSSGGAFIININGAIDPQSTAKQVRKILLEYKRISLGGGALGLA